MNPPIRLLLAALIVGNPIPAVAQITWDGGGADNLWSTAGNWSDESPPAPGSDYLIDGAFVRSPDSNSTSFDGDSLTVQDGGILNLFRTNGGSYLTVTHDIPSLTVSDAEIRPQSSVGSIGHRLSQSVELAGAVTLNMNENSAYTMRMFFGGGVTGSGSLTVTRDATGSTRSFEFAGDSAGYSGIVSFAGFGPDDRMEFNVSNAGGWGSGQLTVGDFSRLNLTTSFTQPTAGLVLGGADTVMEVPSAGVSIGSLVLDDGIIALDLTNPGPDPVADALTLAGDFTVNGGTIVLDLIALPLIEVPYTLVSYGGTLTAHPTLEIVDTVNSALLATIDYGTGENSAITVTFSEFTGSAADLVWTGEVDDLWDVETTANWSDAGSPATYAQFDNVTFDDSAGDALPDVVLDGAVTPGEVTFATEASEYLLTGSGGIGGSSLLTKEGAATVIIATNNAYDGGTDILGGTLQVGNGGTTGTLGGNSVINDATLRFDRSDAFVFSNQISGIGDLDQAGAGSLILTANHTYTGATSVSGGTLQLGDGSSNDQAFIASSSGLIVTGGTILDLPRLHAGGNQNVALILPPVTLENASTLRFRAQTGSNTWNLTGDLLIDGDVSILNVGGGFSQNLNFSGSLAGSGTIVLDAATGSSNRNANFNAADATYSGDWTVRRALGGTPINILNAGAANALGTGTVTVEANARLRTGTAAGLDSLAGVVLAAESASLLTTADTTVATLSGTAGSVEVAAGTLTLATIGIPDAADVRLATGAILHLDFAGTDAIRDFFIDGSPQATGTWGAPGSGADYESSLIAGTGILNVAGSDPFIAWIDSFFPGETDPAIVGKDADPDGDGGSNLVEFATNGNPDNGSASGKVVGLIQDVGGEVALTLTLPVRLGAVFAGTTEQVAGIDGLTYRIQGSGDLSGWTTRVISEITPALDAGLPALDAGWEYRSFRTSGAAPAAGRDFIRASFEAIAP